MPEPQVQGPDAMAWPVGAGIGPDVKPAPPRLARAQATKKIAVATISRYAPIPRDRTEPAGTYPLAAVAATDAASLVKKMRAERKAAIPRAPATRPSLLLRTKTSPAMIMIGQRRTRISRDIKVVK